MNVLPLQIVCEMARNIPCSPWLLPQVMTCLRNEKASVTEIEEVIRKDPGLSATALRIANSAFLSRGSQIDSLNQAILRLGFKEVYKLVVTSISERWLSNEVEGYGWEPGDLYRHSLCVAVGAELIAKKTGWIQPEVAYTAGLLHDVGKLALAYACCDVFDEVRKYQEVNQCSWRKAENDLLGYDHTDIGGTLLEGWSYPANLIEVACFYPTPSQAGHEHFKFVLAIHAAKHLAITMGAGVGEDGFKTEMDHESLESNGIDEDFMVQLLPDVLEGYENITNSRPSDLPE